MEEKKVVSMSFEDFLELVSDDEEIKRFFAEELSPESTPELKIEVPNNEALARAEKSKVELMLTVSELMDISIALGTYVTSGSCVEMFDYGYIPKILELKQKLDDEINAVLETFGIRPKRG